MRKAIYIVCILLLLGACGEKKENNSGLYDQSQRESEPKGEPGKTVGLNIGDVAPEIALPDPSGKVIPLSSLRGKVVLVDFWASWCGPCRRENPNNVRVYQKYKDKGFEIYGVSLDRNMQNWTDAIKADHLDWVHVSDLSYFNSVVVPVYHIEGIPSTVLLDKEGRIIARDLRGEELAEKVKEVMEKP